MIHYLNLIPPACLVAALLFVLFAPLGGKEC